MIYIKNKDLMPITTGNFNGELIYNGRVLYNGELKITKLVRGVFGLNLKIWFYNINDKFFYHEKTDTLFTSKVELNRFFYESVNQIRNFGGK